MIYYTADTYPYEKVKEAPDQKRAPGNQRTRERKVYKDLVCAFDIETTYLKDLDQSFMYIWQAQIEDDTIIGRTWEEFKSFRSSLLSVLAENEWLVFFVHNLSFEYSYISDPEIYEFSPKEVFCMDSRKILKCEMMKHFEFRCSYLHTNMKLSEFLEKMGVPDLKQSGDEYDYSKIRYPWTPLSEKEMLYVVNDVRGLVEALHVEMKHDGKNLYNLPRTATGYVREDVKRAMRSFNHNTLRYMQPDLHLLDLLKQAYRGGNTHSNRYMSDLTIDGPVHSVDLASSYPAVQLTREFPMSQFREVHERDPEFIISLMTKRSQALLMRVAFSFIRLKDEKWPVPYLSKSKCRNLYNYYIDNGRVIAAEYLETTITDVDLAIILEEFEFDEIIFLEVWASRYGMLPQALRDVTIDYYRRKTSLKGVEGQDIFYNKAKNLLNGIYGQSVQKPLKPTILYDHDQFTEKEEDPEKAIETYQRKAYQCYQWGVWISAHARAALEAGIRNVFETPGAVFIYCDTDSVKYKGEVDWDVYNKPQIQRAKKAKAYADDPKGKRHYIGVYERENDMARFRTLGAKKYAYEDMNGKLHITIAGVNKKKGAEELARKGGLEALKEGFTFSESGKTEARYHDRDTAIGWYQVDDDPAHKIYIGKSVSIVETTYTVGLTQEYKELLMDPAKWKKLITDL